MSACLSNSNFHRASSMKLEQDSSARLAMSTTDHQIQRQGIVSILGSDCESTKSASLRRTLSADMSSKKWLAQNGFNFSPMKKIASSEELAAAVSAEYDRHVHVHMNTKEEDQLNRPGQDDVWRSIQSQKKPEAAGQWTFGSILFDKNERPSKLPPPYIPPLVRRSGSSLSDKSLEICTESLGSETGSEDFSSYPPSEVGDVEEEKENDLHQNLSQSDDDLRVVKYSNSHGKKMGPRSFPPPLPSLAREDGASVHMQSHRRNGRLVLEAVSVPSQNYFQAHREHGRLRLSLVNNSPTSEDAREEEIGEEFEQVLDNFEEFDASSDDEASFEEGQEMEEDEEECSDDESPTELQGGLMHVPGVTVEKLLGLDKKNLAWSSRFNKGVNLLEVDDDPQPGPFPQSLPSPPRVARLISNRPSASATTAASSLNAYKYFWRENKQATMAAGIIKPISAAHHGQSPPLKNNQNKQAQQVILEGYERQNIVLMRGNKEGYLVPVWRRCSESRRSLLLWEPYCIAT